MEIRVPFIHGLDELSPLLAYLLIYIVALMFIKLYLIPFIGTVQKNSKLNQYLHTLGLVAQRLMVFGLLLLGFLWALEELGLADGFYNTVGNIPDFTLPSTEVTISGMLIALLLLIYFVITPAFVRRKNRS